MSENGSYTVAERDVYQRSRPPGIFSNDLYTFGATATVEKDPADAASFASATNGGFTYKSVAGYKGTDTFTYHINNGFGIGDPATVTIT